METTLYEQLEINDRSTNFANLKLFCHKNEYKPSMRFICFKCYNILGFTILNCLPMSLEDRIQKCWIVYTITGIYIFVVGVLHLWACCIDVSILIFVVFFLVTVADVIIIDHLRQILTNFLTLLWTDPPGIPTTTAIPLKRSTRCLLTKREAHPEEKTRICTSSKYI